MTGNPTVTAVSKKTGQFWSKQVKGGNAVFQGLYPGKYKLVANGFGIWFGKTGSDQGDNVKSGKTGLRHVHLHPAWRLGRPAPSSTPDPGVRLEEALLVATGAALQRCEWRS